MDTMTNDQANVLDGWRTTRVYYTADLHLGHERIIELCNRPFAGVEEMNEAILDGINRSVTARDSLVVLGDVLLGRFDDSVKLLKRIRAKKVLLVPGNHDRWSLGYHHHGSPEVVRAKRSMFRALYEDARPGIHALVDQVPSGWRTRVRGRAVMLSHYPYVGDSIDGADRHQALRPHDRGIPLLHGHVHGAWQHRGPMYNVGVDVNGFAPVSEDTLTDWLESLPRFARLGSDRPVAAGL